MYTYEHTVRYYETDQMRVVHHSNYIRWFEEARSEFLALHGIDYAVMEKDDCYSPVVSVSCDYITSAKFGETAIVELKLTSFSFAKFSFSYIVTDKQTGNVRATGNSIHCFINGEGKILSLKRLNPKLFAYMQNLVEE